MSPHPDGPTFWYVAGLLPAAWDHWWTVPVGLIPPF
jgi:hypothetical protein